MAAPAFSRAHHQQALHHPKGRNRGDGDVAFVRQQLAHLGAQLDLAGGVHLTRIFPCPIASRVARCSGSDSAMTASCGTSLDLLAVFSEMVSLRRHVVEFKFNV